MQTKSSLNGATYICLENKKPLAGIDYMEAYKLNWEQYEKVIRAKFEKGLLNYVNVLPNTQFPLNQPFDISQLDDGDFVYANGRSSYGNFPGINYGSPLFGYVKKDDSGLYIDAFKLYSGKKSGSKLIAILNCIFTYKKKFFKPGFGRFGRDKWLDKMEDSLDAFSFIPEKIYLTNKNWVRGFQSKAFIDLTILWKRNSTILTKKSAA